MQKKSSVGSFFRGYAWVLALAVVALGATALVFWRTRTADAPEMPASVSVPESEAVSAPAPKPDAVEAAQTETADTVETGITTETVQTAPLPATAPSITRPVAGESIAAFSVDTLRYNATMADWRVHEGVDYAAPLGEKVTAIMDGVVTSIYDDDYLGTVVVLSHDNGWSTLYANLSNIPTVAVGDHVAAGKVIGAVGRTAMLEVADDPHLHLEVYRYGALCDPADLIG